jgi:hypothetical protein
MPRLDPGWLLAVILVLVIPGTAMIGSADAAYSGPVERRPAEKQEPPLTNEEIVKLTQAGLDSDLIVAKVKQAASEDFDVSTDALIELQHKKVAKAVIAAILERVATRSAAAPPPQSAAPGPDQEAAQRQEVPAQEPAPASGDRWHGWITDQRCGVKGAKAEHQSCALRCLDRGSKVVFYNTTDSKLYFLSSKKFSVFSWARFMGRQVTLIGKMNGDTIDVDAITSAAK